MHRAMTNERLPRNIVRYPGVWLALAGAIVIVIALAWLGALELGGPPRTVLVSTLDTQDVHVATITHGDDDVLAVGHHDGVSVSLDGGKSWEERLSGMDAMALAPSVDGSMLVAGHGFMGERGADGQYAALAPQPPDNDVHSLARSRTDPDRVWLATGSGALIRSVNGGSSWTEVESGSILQLATYGDGIDGVYAIDAFRGLVSSDDGGNTWSDGRGLPGVPVNALAASPDGSTLLLGTGEGAFLSDDDGATWERILDRPTAAVALDHGRSGGAVAYLVTTEGEVYRYH